MQGSNRNPFTREDTLLGVCQAIGDDFGFNPIYLRVALSVALLWNPVIVLTIYFGLGVAAVGGRMIVPSPKPLGAAASAKSVPIDADNSEARDMAIAA